jgi:hypothetical protein
MNVHQKPVLVYRWIVFLLAAGYCLDQIFGGNYGGFGGPFRYLTVWALFMSFYAASRMLAFSEGRITNDHKVVASIAAVLNAMVVLQYWRLYFQDPGLVNSGDEIVWYREYYLHLLGPILQWIDALFILGAFRNHRRVMTVLCVIVLAYVGWSEILVGPLNDAPIGRVTTGLPYPFLNNMEPSQRAIFYGINLVVALVFYGLFAGVAAIIRRLLRRPATP